MSDTPFDAKRAEELANDLDQLPYLVPIGPHRKATDAAAAQLRAAVRLANQVTHVIEVDRVIGGETDQDRANEMRHHDGDSVSVGDLIEGITGEGKP